MKWIGWWAMTLGAFAVAGYASMALWNPDAIPFIANRTGVLRSALIMHGAAGAVALAIGPFQFIERLRSANVLLHRVCGSVYVACILVGGATGLWLAFHTPGGVTTNVGFFMLATLWLVTGTLALSAALRSNFMAHRTWMMRSYALTYAAVTLRIQLGVGELAGFTFDELYPMTAWLSWAGNLLFVEWVLLPRYRRAMQSAAARSTERVHSTV